MYLDLLLNLIIQLWQNKKIPILIEIKSLCLRHIPTFRFSQSEAIPQICKTIWSVHRNKINPVVFPPRIPKCLHIVERRTSVYGNDLSIKYY